MNKEDFCYHMTELLARVTDPHAKIHLEAGLRSYQFNIPPTQAMDELLDQNRARIEAENARRRAAGIYPYDGTYK